MSELSPPGPAVALAAPGVGAAGRRLRSHWPMVVSGLVIAGYLVLALLGLHYRPEANVVDVAHTLQPPGSGHIFGTDAQGRDVFQRVCVGAGISIILAVISVVLAALGGLIVALACGLGAPWVDRMLMAPMNALLAFPQLLLALAVSIALGSGLTSAVIGIAITSMPVFALTLRAEAKRSRAEPFVEAAVTIGLPRWRIGLRHVVPYLRTTFTVQVAANFGAAVLTLAALSYIGVGAKPPTPEWGAMISDGLQYAVSGQWWIGVMPGAALLGLVIVVNIFTDQVESRRRMSR
ncbi:ABC transporter permease [Pedococcus sp. P5_B7]